MYGIIHVFRMPVFFIVSGFFAAFLFYKKSPTLMILNRVKRIFFPFIVFIFILTPIARICIKFSTAALKINESSSLVFNIMEHINLFTFLPFHTMHLWFLYYLMLFSIVPFLLNAILFRIRETEHLLNSANKYYDYILSNTLLRLCVLPIITCCILYASSSIWIDASISFIPSIKTFIFYFLFYAFGWFLFNSNKVTLYFKKRALLYTLLGIVLFTFSFIFFENLDSVFLIILNSLSVWLFVYGIIGLFLKYLNFQSYLMKYLLDASYWIYLIHLPLTIFFPGLIDQIEAPLFLKFIAVITIVFFVSILSYHFLVRKTIIGVFLNGRRY